MVEIARIEERLDRAAAGAVAVSDALGGVRFQNMMEVMEFAKLMAISGNAVPKQLQGNPGSCLAVCIQALEWGFSPFSVASMHFEVNGRHAYMSQLIHAVIEKHAPLRQRLRCEYEGENGDMVCVVTGHIRGEVDPLIYRSPKVSAIPTKNSPLWKSDSQQQLWYYASRAWCRRYCPDVLLGVYSRDEIDGNHIGADNAKDVSEKPDVGTRLKGKQGRGFNAQHVENETSQSSAPADAGAATGTVESAAPLDSSQDAATLPETKPAPIAESPSLVGAGTPQSSAERSNPPGTAGEERQATEPGDSALHDSVGLPEDWAKQYAAALTRAQKKDSLIKFAAAFWKPFKGWDAHKNGPNAATAIAIYDAFANNFGPAGEEARNGILRELRAI